MEKMTKLKYKPDFGEACKYWDVFWQKQIIDRPCISITAPKEDCDKNISISRPVIVGSDYENFSNLINEWVSTYFWGAEAIPFWQVSFGPDQFSSFLGAELIQKPSDITSWVVPFVDDWEKVLPLQLKSDNFYWKEMLKLIQTESRISSGKRLVTMLDFHSNMDCLAAIRGTEKLLMDLIDCPDIIEKAINNVRSFYAPIYESIYKAGNMAEQGTIGWSPFYCKEKFAMVQCDFICMISPEMARRFVIPALAEEASYLDHCVYHFDGPNALVHLDDILAIPDIDVIQWVPGTGQPKMIEWMDVLKKIQKAGKGLQIYDCSPEEVKVVHRELRPEGVLYCVEASSEKEANDLISWLKANT